MWKFSMVLLVVERFRFEWRKRFAQGSPRFNPFSRSRMRSRPGMAGSQTIADCVFIGTRCGWLLQNGVLFYLDHWMSRNLEVGERSGPVPVIWECWPNELVSRVRVHAGVAVKWGQSGTSLLRLTHQPHLPPGNAAM